MIPGYPIPYYPPLGNQLPMQISDDAGKIFVGGIPAETTKESLMDYFQQFGDVTDSIIMVDNVTSRSRGFGFVTFVDPNTVNKVLSHSRHSIHGKVIDAKKAVPKGPNQGNILRAMGITSNRADRNPECKVFVGGVAQGTTESDLETHFQEFGKVLEVKIPKDQNTQRARGFSFVLFESRECVINATKERYQKINGKLVEVKTVHLQTMKTQLDEQEDSHMQSPVSPYMQLGQRLNYYQTYPSNYLGMGGMSPQGFYEPSYDPSPSGSTCSAASIGSAGYGNLATNNSTPQRVDEYAYMASLYPAMNELSISQQYARFKRYIPRQLNTPLSYSMQPSSGGESYSSSGVVTPTSVAYHGGEIPNYVSPSNVYNAPTVAAYVPGSSSQSAPSVPGFSR